MHEPPEPPLRKVPHFAISSRCLGDCTCAKLLLFLLAFGQLVGCEPTTSTSGASPAPTSSAGPSAEADLERICGIPRNAGADYTERKRERFDYKATKRVAVRIVVGPGLSREDLDKTIRVALMRTYRSEVAKLGSVGAIDVLAYASDATGGAFSAGRGTLAPEGDWSKASETVPVSEWSVRVEFAEAYFPENEPSPFAENEPSPAPGDWLVIRSDDDDHVGLSREPARWNDEDIIARLVPGTKVQVIAVKAFTIVGGRELVRLKIKTATGAARTGWVHAHATSRAKPDE